MQQPLPHPFQDHAAAMMLSRCACCLPTMLGCAKGAAALCVHQDHSSKAEHLHSLLLSLTLQLVVGKSEGMQCCPCQAWRQTTACKLVVA